MSQHNQVINVMEKNGGYATLGFLYKNVDVSKWGTKTPYASIRRIVQSERYFFKIKPGLWGLEYLKDDILLKFNIGDIDKQCGFDNFNHTYFQGLLVEIGNIKEYDTYIPSQDKNKLFLEKKLRNIVTIDKIYSFSYPDITKRAKTIDVIWFNDRHMPASFFEVEHTTDMQNSIIKFCDLQDFHSNFYIVSNFSRKKEFDKKINYSPFKKIKERIKFIDYEYVAKWYNNISELSLIGDI